MKIEELSLKVSAVAPLLEGELTKKSLLENVAHFFSDDEEFLYVGCPPISTLNKVLFFTNKQVLWFSVTQGKYLKRFETSQIERIEIKHAYSECYRLYLSNRESFEFKIAHKEFAKSFNEKLQQMLPNKVTETNSFGKMIINKSVKYSLIGFAAMIVIAMIGVKIEETFGVEFFPDVETSKPYVADKIIRKVIPGITPGEFYVNFTQRGFSKTGPRKISETVYSPNAGKYTWNLSRTDTANNCTYDIDTYGPDASSMDKILASLICPNPNNLMPNASHFLPFVASLPYEGADTKKASLWVKNNLGQKYIETNFGIVKFRLKQDTAKSIYLYLEI